MDSIYIAQSDEATHSLFYDDCFCNTFFLGRVDIQNHSIIAVLFLCKCVAREVLAKAKGEQVN